MSKGKVKENEKGRGGLKIFKDINEKLIHSLHSPQIIIALWSVWPVKSRHMSIKVAQKWFHQKMKDFDTFTKIGQFGQNNCCYMLSKVAQSGHAVVLSCLKVLSESQKIYWPLVKQRAFLDLKIRTFIICVATSRYISEVTLTVIKHGILSWD